MRSIDERLADSNPVTGGYVPRDYDQMLTRAMHHSRTADGAWRMFRLRMAGSITAASALTVLAVSALTGAGSTLPVLGFQASAAHSSSRPTAATTRAGSKYLGTYDVMPIMMNDTFTGAGAFPSAPGSASVYTLRAPSDLVATLASVASALGIHLAATTSNSTSDSRGFYSVNATGYSGSINSGGGPDYWNIYAAAKGTSGATGVPGNVGAGSSTVTPPTPSATGSTGVSGATGPVVTSGALATQALGYVRALGDYAAGHATRSTSAGTTTITVPLLINGLASDMSDSFTFSSAGTLQNATGDAFSLSAGTTYPLISESAGVGQITTQYRLLRPFFGPGPVMYQSTTTVARSAATGASSVSGVTGPSATTTPPTPTVVHLTTVTTGYAPYDMTGGWMELPVYNYTGTVLTGGYRSNFTVVALPSQYLNFAATTNRVPLGAR
jgi:hypothetical protein